MLEFVCATILALKRSSSAGQPWAGLLMFVAGVRKVLSCQKAVRFYRLVTAEAEHRPQLEPASTRLPSKVRNAFSPPHIGVVSCTRPIEISSTAPRSRRTQSSMSRPAIRANID